MAERSILDSIAELAGVRRAAPTVAHLLATVERWAPEEIECHQLRRCAALIEHARNNVPYYATLPRLPDGDLTAGALGALPVLSRAAVRERFPDLVARSAPPPHRVVREANSSGSTGRHVTMKVDAVSAAVGDALALRAHRWHGRDVRLKAAAIRAVAPDDATSRRVTTNAWSAADDGGPVVVLDARTPVRDQLAWLQREAPAYLATYPSNCEALVARAEAEGVVLPGLREVGTFGEVVPAGLREACRRVWGVPLVDAYSAVETGLIAVQCPDATTYHVQSENVLVELLLEDGSRARPGETGRVVVTALHAFAMPLIRYEIGDYAVAGERCACGRGLPVLERVEGRFRNMMRLPTGDVLWPRYGALLIGKHFPVRQFRLVQKSLSHLVLEVVTDRPFAGSEEARLRETVLDTLGIAFRLDVVEVAEIPRSPGGKFEDFVCELDATDAGWRQTSQ